MARQGTGGAVKTRLYLEGRLVENAMASVMVTGGIGAPATAQIELVPTNTIRHILPGTHVHVFTTDPWDANPAGDLSDFKLLFEGVVAARGFTRQDSGRSFVIQCCDPAIYWTNAKQYWLNIGSANGGIVDEMAVQTSGGYGAFGQVAATGTFGYMVSKLTFEKEQPEERFMDTLISVIDDIGNVNPFYTNARNRYRLTDRIIRGPAGKTVELFQLAMVADLLEGLSGRSSGQTNLSDVVNQLLAPIFHEWVAVPAPPFVEARVFDRDVFGNIKRSKTKVTNRGPRGRTTVDLFEFKTAKETIIGNYFFKPHIYTISPPTCNVLFPNMYEQINFSESFLAEPTRLSMKPQLPMLGPKATQGMLLQRPTEFEVYTALVHDPKSQTPQKRTPDGQFGDGAGQVPTFTDYDWSTNEERIRGIVYDFINLAPAPSTLTLADPGKKQPNGQRKGGVPHYLKNVASYEYYKAKFSARQCSLRGQYNMRVVPGFPLVALDDSAAGLNVIAYLESVQHNIDAQGNASTQYNLQNPRMTNEVDYNQPKFKGGTNAKGELDFDLVRDENGQYDFTQLFGGTLQPPVPEWFDESFRNDQDLDIRYKEWFGKDAGVIQNCLFKDIGEKPSDAAVAAATKVFGDTGGTPFAALGAFASVGAAAYAYIDRKPEFEKLLEENDNISITDAINELNAQFTKARKQGMEFELASRYTARSFVKIDEAFRFLGAAPLELADPVKKDATEDEKKKGPQFTKNPASTRTINYRTMRLDNFVGDTSTGSGYNATPESDTTSSAPPPEPVVDAITTAAAAAPGSPLATAPSARMSGAFPVFDTTIHTGTQATDAKVRSALISSAAERGPSDRARYDGRPLMFDFEFRLWQQSMKDAGLTPTGEVISDNAATSDYYQENTNGSVVRPKTPEETVAAVEQRQANLKKQGAKNAKAHKASTMSTKDQAPTGAGLEEDKKHPLPQPLSEKQVIDIRRAIIDAYRDELARTRGFTG